MNFLNFLKKGALEHTFFHSAISYKFKWLKKTFPLRILFGFVGAFFAFMLMDKEERKTDIIPAKYGSVIAVFRFHGSRAGKSGIGASRAPMDHAMPASPPLFWQKIDDSSEGNGNQGLRYEKGRTP